MTISIRCCVDCVCVPMCKQKDENALIYSCSIIQDEIKSTNIHIGKNGRISVFISDLNRELLVDRGSDFLFISPSAADPYSTLIPIKEVPVS